MLFNSLTFVFVFMPIVCFGYFVLGRRRPSWAITWLVLASLFFYAYWNYKVLPILVISIAVNYAFGILLSRSQLAFKRSLLWLAIGLNLLLLAYFKYVNFFADLYNDLTEQSNLEPIGPFKVLLPIGISFFTFTQIAFLLDCFQAKVKERVFTQYALFVSFFPHLLAGPLLHHRQMMPQFSKADSFVFQKSKFVAGLVLFVIGLAKKLLLADVLNSYVAPFYESLAQGHQPNFWAAWLACLAYNFQLYFDFSGYSDMAVGLALLFGIVLPFNFNSPLRASSMIDFWQRWHMTLTKYAGDYLYMPLTLYAMRSAQNFWPPVRVFCSLLLPTFFVFLLIGFWHGANWTFLAFGALHGLFVVVNHLWRMLPAVLNKNILLHRRWRSFYGWGLTFVCVSLASVMFRADSVQSAWMVYKGLLGWGGFSFGYMPNFWAWFDGLRLVLFTLLLSFFLILGFPNSIYWLEKTQSFVTAQRRSFLFYTIPLLLLIYGLLRVAVYESPFLYFQF